MDTRSSILSAALAVFVARGYDASTMQAIREQAGISNGSLFHFFRSKEALGAALYQEGILSYQQGLLETLQAHSADAASGIPALVTYHLQWVEKNVQLSRFLFERGHPDWGPDHIEAIRTANTRTYQSLGNWLTALMQSGQLRQQPLAVAVALLQGSTLSLSRAWLEDAGPGKLSRHAIPLANSLCAALGHKSEPEN